MHCSRIVKTPKRNQPTSLVRNRKPLSSTAPPRPTCLPGSCVVFAYLFFVSVTLLFFLSSCTCCVSVLSHEVLCPSLSQKPDLSAVLAARVCFCGQKTSCLSMASKGALPFLLVSTNWDVLVGFLSRVSLLGFVLLHRAAYVIMKCSTHSEEKQSLTQQR